MEKKIKGKAFVKIGAYWLPEKEAEIIGVKRLLRSNENMIGINGPVRNGEIILENAYYYPEDNKIIIEIKCDDK